MAASVFDSPMFTRLFPVGDTGRLFTDNSEVRAVLLVLGTLAKVQGEAGLIPEDSAFFIHRSAMEVQVDPAALATEIGTDGDIVAPAVAAFAKAMEAPQHSQYIFTNADAQDIAEAALLLRLRQLLALLDKGLTQTHANNTAPSQLQASQFQACHDQLPQLRDTALRLRFDTAPDIGAALAKALNLGFAAPDAPNIGSNAIVSWLASVTQTLAGHQPLSPAQAALGAQVQALLPLVQSTPLSKRLALPQIALAAAAAVQIYAPGALSG